MVSMKHKGNWAIMLSPDELFDLLVIAERGRLYWVGKGYSTSSEEITNQSNITTNDINQTFASLKGLADVFKADKS